MNEYRIDYISMHDESGRPVNKEPITIKTYVPALNNVFAYFAFVRKVVMDAKALNLRYDGQVPFDFYVSRAKHYGYLYTEVPKGAKEAMLFYKGFFLKII